MRFLQYFRSKQDDKDVYTFRLGADELKLIRDCVKVIHQETPKIMETMSARGKMHNIENIIDRALSLKLDEQKVPIQDTTENMDYVIRIDKDSTLNPNWKNV